MSQENYLYKTSIEINQHISVRIPTVGEVIEHEEEYYNLSYLIPAMPIDLMVQLNSMGIDFTTIDGYQLFLMLFDGFKSQDTSLIFGDLDLSRFQHAMNEENGEVVLIDRGKNIVIDKEIYNKIAKTIRKIHHIKQNIKTPANEEAKRYMIERATKKARIEEMRNKNKEPESQLESIIIAMVNTEQFKYNFETVKNMSIYAFNESVKQVIHKIDYDNRMHGVYAGTVDVKELSQDQLNWLSHK